MGEMYNSEVLLPTYVIGDIVVTVPNNMNAFTTLTCTTEHHDNAHAMLPQILHWSLTAISATTNCAQDGQTKLGQTISRLMAETTSREQDIINHSSTSASTNNKDWSPHG